MAQDRERRQRMISGMKDAGLDALVCSAASDVLLLSGYWPVMSMSIAVMNADGKCVVILPKDEEEMASRSSSDRLVTFKPQTLTTLLPLQETMQGPLQQVLSDLGVLKGKLGLRDRITEQPSSYVVGCNFHDTLALLLEKVAPAAHRTSGDRLLDQQKSAKTPVELDMLDRAAAIVAAGFAAAPAAIQAGLREPDVAAKIQAAFDTARAAENVQRSYGSFYCMSGPNSAKASAAFARTRERTLETGDLVMIHANTCADGFWTDVTRTYTVGPVPERHKLMRTSIMEARKAGLAAIAPKVIARDVDHAVRDVMKAHGFGKEFVHPSGHGVGFAAANADGIPRIHPLSPDVLEVGSTFNLEPAAYFEGYGGMRHCDLVAVTESGVRVLTEFD